MMQIGGIQSSWFTYSEYKLASGGKLPLATLKTECKDAFAAHVSGLAARASAQPSSGLQKDGLNDTQLAALREKYAGAALTSDTYQALLRDLTDMGTVTEAGKYQAGAVKSVAGYQLSPVLPVASATAVEASSSSAGILSAPGGKADITAWVKYRASCDTYYYDAAGSAYKSNESQLFGYLSDIIAAINKEN